MGGLAEMYTLIALHGFNLHFGANLDLKTDNSVGTSHREREESLKHRDQTYNRANKRRFSATEYHMPRKSKSKRLFHVT